MNEEKKDLIQNQEVEVADKALDQLAQPEEGKQENTQEETNNTDENREASPEQPKESEADRNFKRMREEKEKAERERDEMLKWVYQNQQGQQQQQQQTPKEEPTNLNPDDLVEWRYVDKEIKKLKNELNTYKQESSQSMQRSQLRSQYPDFDKVVNNDTIKSLQKEYPELAATIDSSHDLYNTGVSAYTMIKKLGIYQDNSQYLADKQRLLENSAKPRSAATVGAKASASPLGNVGAFEQGLTPDLKDKLYKEMLAYRNQG